MSDVPWKVTFVVPCYNEKATIGRALERVRAVDFPVEVVVVDDGSTDGTRELLQGPLKGLVDKLVLQDGNRGKGAALRAGFAAAGGDFVIVQDADLEYDPSDVRRLLEPVLAGNADVVYGSRFMGQGPHRVLYFRHYLANALLTFLSNLFTNLNITDMETCYKLFRREVIQSIRLEEDRFGFEPEVTAKVARRGCRVYEVGISYAGRTYEEGKKIRAKDGLRALYCIVKYGLFRRAPAQVKVP